ncbi:hypothetical protein D3C75_574080 [compost metagenome]
MWGWVRRVVREVVRRKEQIWNGIKKVWEWIWVDVVIETVTWVWEWISNIL